jgi:hypothetical protein
MTQSLNEIVKYLKKYKLTIFFFTFALNDLDLRGCSLRKGRAASFCADVNLAGIVIGMCFTGAALVGATVFEEGLSFFNN